LTPDPNVPPQPLWFHQVEPKFDTSRRLCEHVAIAVAAVFAVPLGELRATTRHRSAAAFARQSAMYLAHVALGLSLTEVGRAFGRDRTTAAYACGRVENLRDDATFDAMLHDLECTCGALRLQLIEHVTQEVRS
jgi:chromosomal replication initiation ATPase DnaA